MAPEGADARRDDDTEALEGWNAPLPEHLPTRTPWPVATALGTVLIFWGVVTSYLVLGVGVALLALSMVGWINEIRREGLSRE